jgi:hypothetical protein
MVELTRRGGWRLLCWKLGRDFLSFATSRERGTEEKGGNAPMIWVRSIRASFACEGAWSPLGCTGLMDWFIFVRGEQDVEMMVAEGERTTRNSATLHQSLVWFCRSSLGRSSPRSTYCPHKPLVVELPSTSFDRCILDCSPGSASYSSQRSYERGITCTTLLMKSSISSARRKMSVY